MYRKKRGMRLKIFLIVILLSPIFLFSEYYVNINSHKNVDNSGQPISVVETDSSQQKEIEEEIISVTFGGDVMMDSYFKDYIDNFGVDYSWTNIKNILEDSDIACINLETSVSARGESLKKEGYGFRSQPYTLEGLVNAGIDIVNVANNHTYDYGRQAFSDTLNHLKEYKIEFSGGGKNKEEAFGVRLIEKGGLKVGFISFSEIIPFPQSKADENNAGIAYFDKNNYELVLETIAQAKAQCDILITMLHWGVEYSDKPAEYQVELAHKVIDYGADAVIGHHAHVLQGIETYNGKPILYSIGNLLFLKKNEEAGKTALFELTFSGNRFVGGTIYPVHIDKCKANLLDEKNPLKQEIIDKLSTLSQEFQTKITQAGTF